MLLRPLPYPAPDRLMAVWEVNHRGTYSRLADPNFDDFRDRNRTLRRRWRNTPTGVTSVAGAAEPTRMDVATVTKDFFTVLGVQPSLGRGLTAEDARVGAEPVGVVSHRYWTQSLGSAKPLADLHLRIEGRIYTVVGVMPAGFQFPAKADLWRPAELNARERQPDIAQLPGDRSPAGRRERRAGQRPISAASPRTSSASQPSRATTC